MKRFKVLFKRSNGELRLLGYTGDVTGQEEVIYDYKAGKFISAKSLTGKFKDLKNASEGYKE